MCEPSLPPCTKSEGYYNESFFVESCIYLYYGLFVSIWLLIRLSSKDVEAIQDVTGIDNQAGMDSLNLSSKHRTKMLPNAHIEKFLAGNSKPMAGMRKNMLKSTLFEARVHHTTNVSRFPGNV